MKIDYDVLLMIGMLVSYIYTSGYAHIIFARMDKVVKIQRQINSRNIATALGKVDLNDPEMRKALFLLKVSQGIIYLFIGFLVLDILVKTEILVKHFHFLR